MINVLQYFEFASTVNFKHKKTCEISTENYVLCSFVMEKDPIIRNCSIRMDLRKKNYVYVLVLIIKFKQPGVSIKLINFKKIKLQHLP
jgi:hypothetical protein